MAILPSLLKRIFGGASQPTAQLPAQTDVLVHKIPEHLKQDRQEQYRDYYDEKIEQIHQYFDFKGYHVSDAALNIMLRYKQENDSWRKDGYTPPEGHEIDLLLSRISAIESGDIDIESVEAKYGSIEKMLTSIIVHDLGEDYGLMPEDLKTALAAEMATNFHNLPSQQQILIKAGAENMERMTHDRHYLLDEFTDKFGAAFEHKTGKELVIPTLEKGQILSLDEDVKDFLWSKMNVLSEDQQEAQTNLKPPENFQAFIKIDKKGRTKISVTRHGRKNAWGASWDSYINCVMHNAYDTANKFADSVNGMTSRLAIESFTRIGYQKYLDQRQESFSLNDARFRAVQAFPELQKDLDSLGGMMGIGFIFGKRFANHYSNPERIGESGNCPHSMPKEADGVISINPYDYFERGFSSYDLTPGLSHPIGRFMQQYRDVVEIHKDHPWGPDVAELYKQTRLALIKHGKEHCPNIEMLIDNPAQFDPMPDILTHLEQDFMPVRTPEAYTVEWDPSLD